MGKQRLKRQKTKEGGKRSFKAGNERFTSEAPFLVGFQYRDTKIPGPYAHLGGTHKILPIT